MLQKLRELSIASKLALIALSSILLVLTLLSFYAVSASKNALMEREVQALQQQNQLVIDMIDAYDQSIRSPLLKLLNVFRNLYPQTFLVSNEKVDVGTESLPILLADMDEVNNETFQVDRFKEMTNGVATVFLKQGEDFYRVTTSVVDGSGDRAVGTTLSRQSAAYAALMREQSYVGPVSLFGKSYIAAYEPIRNGQKELVGAFFIGMDFETELAALKKKIKDIRIGNTGYYVVVDATPGPQYGKMLIHPSMEGKKGLGAKDADGKFIVKEALEAKRGIKHYNWKNPNEAFARPKVASYLTYDKWNWLIFGSSYVDELSEGAEKLARNLIAATLLCGLLLSGLLYFFLSRQITKPLANAMAIAESVAAGDLTRKIDITRRDEAGKLLGALQTMSDGLSRIARTVHERSTLIQDGARQISMGNMDVSQRTEEQASTLEETAASVESVSAAARDNAAIAAQGRKLATDAALAAAENASVMSRLSDTISSMHVSSKQISDIVGVIDGLAFQTNILALNAAVEAARAGEQGRGFAVVASEVRSLAQRSGQSAKDIRGIIAQSTASMEQGTMLAQEVARSSQNTQRSIHMVTELMGQIADGSRDQSMSIEQINQAMGQLDNVTQQNAALVEQASAAAQSLEEQAYHLLEAVKQLRFERGAPSLTPHVVDLPMNSSTQFSTMAGAEKRLPMREYS